LTNLGHSGLKAPRLWLGAMMFGDQTDEDEAANIVAAARDAGVYAIDTSDNYAGGESERMVGRLITADRKRWIVATKVANPMGPGPNQSGLSRRWVLEEVDNSLRRLGTDWSTSTTCTARTRRRRSRRRSRPSRG
jgi:aryl-alcohol dehydrogenase (NADP+)